jgi:preprotein translocase subunit SecD
VGDRAAAALRRDYFTTCAEIAADVRAAHTGLDRGRAGRPAAGSECSGALGAGRVEKGTSVVKVPRGIAVIAAEDGGWWVVEDDAELAGGEIKNPEQQLDPLTNEPIVTFGFNADGREAFARMTLRIVERGVRADSPQRFAIVLDDRVMSLAQVDHVANPEGLDGSAGAALTGVGNLHQSQQLARTLDVGPLPLDLQVVEAP